MLSRATFRLVLTVLCLSGCASAGKRLEQGQKLELQGRYEDAVVRYAQALEKDPSLESARLRLYEAGNAAVNQRLEDSAHWVARQDPGAAATQYRHVDASVARARSVGVKLEIPADYEERRRAAFDTAIEVLTQRAELAAEQRRWDAGVESYRLARQDFEPSQDQATASLSGEAGLLVRWSQENLDAGRLRSAYDVAARVQALEWSPEEQQAQAGHVMACAVDAGRVDLLVLPLMSSRRRHGERQGSLAARVNEQLLREAWQAPSPFIHVTDPGAVRDLSRHLGGVDAEFRAPALVALLKLSDSDFGAWLQLVDIEETEFEVTQTQHAVQTHDGQSVQIVLEQGQRRLQAQAHVAVVDRYGNTLADVVVAGCGSASFRRGVYDGDPTDLNLNRQQIQWFDQLALAAQEESAREAVASDLCRQIATAVLDPVLATVP